MKMLTVNVCNTPEDMNYDFIVARLDKNQLWYWGSYESEEKANEVAAKLGDALVVIRE